MEPTIVGIFDLPVSHLEALSKGIDFLAGADARRIAGVTS